MQIPSINDIPVDFRVTLLSDAPNTRAIHSSKVRERTTAYMLRHACIWVYRYTVQCCSVCIAFGQYNV